MQRKKKRKRKEEEERGRGRGDVCVHTLRMPGEPPLTQSLSISRSLRLPRSAVGEPVKMGGM